MDDEQSLASTYMYIISRLIKRQNIEKKREFVEIYLYKITVCFSINENKIRD
jgi:hypothetical protein